jgi:hypothetical protein
MRWVATATAQFLRNRHAQLTRAFSRNSAPPNDKPSAVAMDTTERAAATPVAPVLPGVKEHLVHHDYTVRSRLSPRATPPALALARPALASRSAAPALSQWLSAETARSHALHEICKQFNCTEQGAKNAMSRREIPECKDWHHHNGTWKQKETPGGSVKMPAGHPISKIVGKRSFPDGTIQYKGATTNSRRGDASRVAAASFFPFLQTLTSSDRRDERPRFFFSRSHLGGLRRHARDVGIP